MATAATRFAPGVSRDPSSFPGAFTYEHADVPPGRTLAEHRRELAAAHRHRSRRIRRFVGRVMALAAGPGR